MAQQMDNRNQNENIKVAIVSPHTQDEQLYYCNRGENINELACLPYKYAKTLQSPSHIEVLDLLRYGPRAVKHWYNDQLDELTKEIEQADNAKDKCRKEKELLDVMGKWEAIWKARIEVAKANGNSSEKEENEMFLKSITDRKIKIQHIYDIDHTPRDNGGRGICLPPPPEKSVGGNVKARETSNEKGEGQ